MKQVESAALTDVGQKRKINQDAFFLDDQMGLYVVADGMGGHKAGEVAARMVVESMRNTLANKQAPVVSSEEDGSLSETAGRLVGAIHRTNLDVYQASQESESLQGMGSTVSAVFLSGNAIIGANVGDSPIYLIHGDQIDEISMAHSLEGNARHILTQAIGTQDTVFPYACEVQSFPGDMLVICSDGLSNKVTKEEINQVAQSMPPEQACRHLVSLANKRGGEDNITVLITKIKPLGFSDHPVIKPFVHFFRRAFTGLRDKR